MEFGDILKQLRKQRGLSQDELAALLGTTKQVISRYETKQRVPRLSVVAQFAAKLGVPLSALSGQSDEPHEITPESGVRRVPILGGVACGEPIYNPSDGTDFVSIDENIPMPKAKAVTDKYNVTIGGNIPLTTTMLFGNQQDNMKYVVDMVDSVDPRNLIIAPGCDMPYDVPIENGIAVAEAARDIPKFREMLKDYESVGDDFEVEMPDYEHLEKPLIEAMTLDSAQCAACGYMWNTVKDAIEKYGDKIECHEYKYCTREGIARSRKIGAKQLPSLFINGKLYYESIIPSTDEFFAEIDKLLAK